MYLTDEMKKEIKKYKSAYFCEKLDITNNYLCGLLTGRNSCRVTLAKAMISFCFDISFADENIDVLLKQYFTTKEKEA